MCAARRRCCCWQRWRRPLGGNLTPTPWQRCCRRRRRAALSQAWRQWRRQWWWTGRLAAADVTHRLKSFWQPPPACAGWLCQGSKRCRRRQVAHRRQQRQRQRRCIASQQPWQFPGGAIVFAHWRSGSGCCQRQQQLWALSHAGFTGGSCWRSGRAGGGPRQQQGWWRWCQRRCQQEWSPGEQHWRQSAAGHQQQLCAGVCSGAACQQQQRQHCCCGAALPLGEAVQAGREMVAGVAGLACERMSHEWSCKLLRSHCCSSGQVLALCLYLCRICGHISAMLGACWALGSCWRSVRACQRDAVTPGFAAECAECCVHTQWCNLALCARNSLLDNVAVLVHDVHGNYARAQHGNVTDTNQHMRGPQGPSLLSWRAGGQKSACKKASRAEKTEKSDAPPKPTAVRSSLRLLCCCGAKLTPLYQVRTAAALAVTVRQADDPLPTLRRPPAPALTCRRRGQRRMPAARCSRTPRQATAAHTAAPLTPAALR